MRNRNWLTATKLQFWSHGMFKRGTELHFSISSLFSHNSPNTVQYYVYDSLWQSTERMFSQLSFLEPHCHTDVSKPVQLKCQQFFLPVLMLKFWMALPQPRLLHKSWDMWPCHWDAQTCFLSMSTSPVQLSDSVMAGSLPGGVKSENQIQTFLSDKSRTALCTIKK